MHETPYDFFSLHFLLFEFEFDSVRGLFRYLLFPEFQPEPAFFASEADVTHEEVPFEKYVYMAAFRHEEVFGTIEAYQEYFKNWTDSTPAFLVSIDAWQGINQIFFSKHRWFSKLKICKQKEELLDFKITFLL